MQIFKEKAALQSAIISMKTDNTSVGFVPTMGALHEGHLSLVRQAASICDIVVVSIFINPTQFDNPSDLINYPRTLESDIALLEATELNLLIYTPSPKDLYGEKIESEHFEYGGLEFEMEGKFRNGHFDGVGTVVKKLFEVVNPDKAFFGEKDFQQLQIIKSLVKTTNLPVEIVGCPIDRELNGLARSSRNERLTARERTEAAFIFQILNRVKEKFGTESANDIAQWVKTKFKTHPVLKLEYFEIADSDTLKSIENKDNNKPYRAFIAAYAGEVRLIDNIALNY